MIISDDMVVPMSPPRPMICLDSEMSREIDLDATMSKEIDLNSEMKIEINLTGKWVLCNE